VLVEKPLADTTRGLRELVAKAAEHQVRAAVAYNLRYKPSLQYVRQQVLAGGIGEVLSVRAEVGSVLAGLAPGNPLSGQCLRSGRPWGRCFAGA
jgi:predicted dehydrogenase